MPSDKHKLTTGSPFEAEMAYSRAVVQGDWCFVSGITGYDYVAMSLPETIAEQAENCFTTLRAVLSEAGFAMSDIVRVQYTVTDRALVEALKPVFQTHLGEVRPAATMVIAQLIRAEMLFEVEVTAFRG